MQGEWTLVISAAGLAVIILSSVIGLVWKLSRIELALRSEFAKSMSDFQDDHTRQIGEMKAAHAKEVADLHAKVYQVEIWSRDEFVRKGSFETVIARMEKGFGELRSEITGRLDKMADRIEHMGQRS